MQSHKPTEENQTKEVVSKKSVIIMDEVDGVGAGDRGGIRALIDIIKTTRTPIICICNDRGNTKLKSLLNYVYDLKFNKPQKADIMARISQVCANEQLQIESAQIEKIIEASGQDIRQIINMLQMWKNQKFDVKTAGKDESVMINNFEAGTRLLNFDVQQRLYPKFPQKVNLYFIDYDMVPLLVQDQYLNAMYDQKTDLDTIERMAEASEFISLGDTLNIRVRQHQDWSLLPNVGFASCVAPSLLARGKVNQCFFPAWLGKNSSARKASRLIRELKAQLGHKANFGRMAIQNEIVPLILDYFLKLMKEENFQELVDFMDDYNISREMYGEHMMGLAWGSKMDEAFKNIPAPVKAAFTRLYNS